MELRNGARVCPFSVTRLRRVDRAALRAQCGENGRRLKRLSAAGAGGWLLATIKIIRRIDFSNVTIGFINYHPVRRLRYNSSMKTTSRSATISLETFTPRIVALGLLAFLVLLAMTGCKNQTRATAAINPAGVYTLVSVDDKSVPCSLTHEGAAMTVKSGVFTINADGSCRSLITFSVPPHQDINREVKATYKRQGAELTMRWEGAGMTTGQINGNQFTMTNEGMVFSYRK